MKHCYDALCQNSPQHQLLGHDACTAHYIEALEHFAHLAEEKLRRLMAADASTCDSHAMAKALSGGRRGFQKVRVNNERAARPNQQRVS